MNSMKFVLVFTLAIDAAASAVTPVQKVIQMLTDMKATGQKEMQAEQEIFAHYSKQVRLQSRELSQEITTSKATIEKLIAFVTKADADVAKMHREITENEKESGSLEKDQKASQDLRAEAKEKFLAEQTDYSESLYALDRAIEQLKAQDYDRPQAMMMIQTMSKTVRGMRRVLASLMIEQGRSESAGAGAPAVAGYEFQSSTIVDLLTKLKDNFRKELGDLEKEEMNANHAFDMEMVHLTDTLENLKAERQELVQAKANTQAQSAAKKGELADTKASLADAEKFLADTKATFETKSSTYEANQKVRKEELEALGKAVEIISNPNVSDAYGKHVNAELVQQPVAAKLGFLQMHSGSRRQASRNEALEFLRTRAKALNSDTLSKFAATLTASSPFDKVIKMIEDLLTKLKEDAASEADHKAYCDKELKTNKLKRNKKEAEVEGLRAEIEQKVVSIADMAKRISTLAAEQAELRENVAEATKTRSSEKAENEVAIKDSAEAQVAVSQAIAVLKDFYGKQGESFLQQAPAMEAYTGMGSAQGGVVGMLEVIQSDFARVETDTRAAETQAASEYKAFMSESESSLKSKHDAEFKLSLEKDAAEYEQEQLEKNLASSSKQLAMANAYYEELKPQCVQVQVTYADRAAMRQDEIKALQEAYKILDQKR